jgi:hypothetical protein
MADMTTRDTIGRFTAARHTDPEVGLDLHEAYLEDDGPADFDIDAFHDLHDEPEHLTGTPTAETTDEQERVLADIDAYFDRAMPEHLTHTGSDPFGGDGTPF